MSITWIILIILILLLVGVLPTWPYSRGYGTYGSPGYYAGWGWGPSGIIGLLFIILLIYLLVGGNHGVIAR